MIQPFLMPLYVGEVPIIFWLLIKGAGETRLTEGSALADA